MRCKQRSYQHLHHRPHLNSVVCSYEQPVENKTMNNINNNSNNNNNNNNNVVCSYELPVKTQ